MKKNTIFIIIVVAVAVLAALVIWRFGQEAGEPAQTTPPVTSAPKQPTTAGAQDTTTAINDQLGEIDLNNLDGEFSEIDKDLQSL